MLGQVGQGSMRSWTKLNSCVGMSLACHPTACMMSSSSSTAAATPPMQDVATFAAGCFWGVELHFQRVPGVLVTRVGYTNGHTLNPTYKDICRGDTGHAEAVQVTFDSAIVPYKDLLEKFWSIHDPTTLNQQKNDVGTQYRSGIYYHNDEQKALAEASKATQQTHLHATALLPRIISSRDIVTEIEPAGVFYPAEDYHQQYLQKGGQCAKKGTTDSIRCYG
ncbi:peptide-methionine (S)-S-oxide reductase [Aphanomyces astaci]|uniref:peptide-methionine (S)-S-oxide reductase n=1 Tax=Aphanomyces astaci TaxID=112090 RepID=W4GGM3_APHAT|nr:peptide-methionine (S)-S-oxide reductase [Aphanomyces astaci]ETV78199.1 peptide-methionine (S)-S-oxide reductase [Aphanomyces astaci]|eukprot:XP_009832536.1 peptide-methionine (S)-S-oxide reductase [Aphanomyces astaci]